MAPLLRNPVASHRPPVCTFGPGAHTVRTERWRYIRYPDGSDELYDHGKDPYEWTNLALQPRHAQLRKELGRWLPATSAPPAPRNKTYDFDFATYTWKRKAEP